MCDDKAVTPKTLRFSRGVIRLPVQLQIVNWIVVVVVEVVVKVVAAVAAAAVLAVAAVVVVVPGIVAAVLQ